MEQWTAAALLKLERQRRGKGHSIQAEKSPACPRKRPIHGGTHFGKLRPGNGIIGRSPPLPAGKH